ncbi:MAG: prolyl oligopeptidase family serine peptidase [Gammaproteobacteria bacterium]
MTQEKTTAPAGTWPSPFTTDLVVAGSRRLADPRIVGEDVFWLEGRPEEKGRVVLVRETPNGRIDLTPQPFGVRGKIHEYGGGSYAIGAEHAYLINASDQCLYRVSLEGGTPELITTKSKRRFGDLLLDAHRQRILAACEDHAGDGEPVTTLVAIDLTSGRIDALASGADFYSTPTLSPDGRSLAFLSWDHPDMPWDANTLWHASVDEAGELHDVRDIGHADTSHFQPTFAPDGSLYVVADNDEWWNLQRLDGDAFVPIAPCPREFAFPQWVFGMRTFAFVDDHTIAAISTAQGQWQLHTIDTRDGTRLDINAIDTSTCDQVAAGNGRIAVIAGGPTQPLCIYTGRADDSDSWQMHQRSSDLTPDPASISVPQPTTIRPGRAHECHGFYYAPTSTTHTLPSDERPPLLIKCHGGPTGATNSAFDPRIQYWTSRGIAVFDLNYRGSTGFGREFRHALRGKWGVSDLMDCRHVVEDLVARGLADPERCLISGGSAGGYTVLSALTFDNVFAAGASHYGIGDLELLARDTHKFESRSLDRLVGPYPQARDTYLARSPIAHVDQLNCPVIFFQGIDDHVVPPNQAQTMVAALEDKGVTVAYVPFEGEGHGFRNADNIKYALAAELAFYGHVLGFTPDGPATDLTHVLIEAD